MPTFGIAFAASSEESFRNSNRAKTGNEFRLLGDPDDANFTKSRPTRLECRNERTNDMTRKAGSGPGSPAEGNLAELVREADRRDLDGLPKGMKGLAEGKKLEIPPVVAR